MFSHFILELSCPNGEPAKIRRRTREIERGETKEKDGGKSRRFRRKTEQQKEKKGEKTKPKKLR